MDPQYTYIHTYIQYIYTPTHTLIHTYTRHGSDDGAASGGNLP